MYLKIPDLDDAKKVYKYEKDCLKYFPKDTLYLTKDNFKQRLKEFEEKKSKDMHSYTYFIINDGRIVGTCQIRLTPEVNEKIGTYGGHISYNICPEYQNKGYATKALNLLLKKCLDFGLKEVMVTTKDYNIASQKVILKNHGVLKDKVSYYGDKDKIMYRYVIDVEKSIRNDV